MGLTELIGEGTIVFENRVPSYKGELPCSKEEQDADAVIEVVVMRREHYDQFMKGHEDLFYKHRAEMSLDQCRIFPDTLTYTTKGDEPQTTTLYLQRFIFSNDPSRSLTFMYKSLDESLDEETP